MKDIIELKGRYNITSIDERSGRIIESIDFNVVTQLLFTGLFKLFNYDTDLPTADSLNFTHIAIGTGLNAASKSDTTLQTETFRKVLASKTYNSDTFVSKTSIAASEGNPGGGFIEEVACFAKATDTANSGTIVSRANVHIAKNTNIKLVISWTLIGA